MTIAVSTTHRLALTAALLLGTTSMVLAQSVFTSTHAPMPIPPSGSGPGTTQSTIQVGDQGRLMRVRDVNVGLTLNHTFQGDLRVAVAAPSGTSVELFGQESSGTGCGGLGGGVDLNGTYVFDQAASVGYTEAVVAAVGPGILESGTYAQGNNAVGLLSDFNGTAAAGDWTLTITDTCAGDSGTLTQWQLIMQFAMANQAHIQPMLGHILRSDNDLFVGRRAERAGAVRAIPEFGDGGDDGTGFWLRSGGERDRTAGALSGLFEDAGEIDTRRRFVQAGVTLPVAEAASGRWLGTLMGHHGNSDSRMADGTGFAVGSADITSTGVGAGLTWLGDGGTYVDLLGIATWSDIDIATASGGTGGTDALTLAASIEAGHRIDLAHGFSITPQAQAIFQRVSIDDFTDSDGIASQFERSFPATGRLGFEVERAIDMDAAILTASAGAHVIATTGGSAATLDGASISFDPAGEMVELTAGLTAADRSNTWKAGLSGSMRHGIGGDRQRSYGIRGFASINW